MKKLFRFHRGGFAESIKTTIMVKSVDDLRQILSKDMPYAHNIRISRDAHMDYRLPDEWGGYSRYVLADIDGYSEQCIGMCNFYEE